MKTRALLLSLASLALVSACSTVPQFDPCSPEGVAYRLETTLKAFASDNRGDIRDVRNAASYIDGETTFAKMRLAFALNALRRLAESFEEDVVPQLEGIRQECGTDARTAQLFLDTLRNEGIRGRTLEWAEQITAVFEAVQGDLE